MALKKSISVTLNSLFGKIKEQKTENVRNASLYLCTMQSLLQAAVRVQRSSKTEKKLSEATNISIKLPLLTLSKTIIFNVFGTEGFSMQDFT